MCCGITTWPEFRAKHLDYSTLPERLPQGNPANFQRSVAAHKEITRVAALWRQHQSELQNSARR